MTAAVKIRPAEKASPADLASALFEPMGAKGLYARRGVYEGVVEALSSLITRYRAPEAEVFRFPPVMSRARLEASGYLKSFPNLLGCVSCLCGGEAEIRSAVGEESVRPDWIAALEAADLVLTPASCYPVYPIAAERGPAPAGGRLFDVGCECFRREPSDDIDRMQSFRMREYVCVGTGAEIARFREAWMKRAGAIAATLGLEAVLDQANDPFFGRGGRILAASQREQSLKFELLSPILPNRPGTACMSFNYHQDHFGRLHGLVASDGGTAHTGCVAFGMDRLALALFTAHGPDPRAWPGPVRIALDL